MLRRAPFPFVLTMQRFLPRHEPPPHLHPRGDADGLRIRWLGTAGHVVQTGSTTILLDPFLSRPGLLRTGFTRLRPTPDAWWRWLPESIDAIACGHSHYDHIMDAPVIAARPGCLLLGSRTTLAFARAHGVPEAQLIEIPASGATHRVGDVDVRFVCSLHGRILAGRVPLPGEVRSPPRLPARMFHYRMGGAFGIHLATRWGTVYHNGSADLVDAELEGLDADVMLVGLAGRQATPRYIPRLMQALKPRVVVPTHHDAFFAGLELGVRLLPSIDLPGFSRQVGALDHRAEIRLPTYETTLVVNHEEAVFQPR